MWRSFDNIDEEALPSTPPNLSSRKRRRRRIFSTATITCLTVFAALYKGPTNNDSPEVTIRARDLFHYIDDEVSAADWPPSDLLERVADERKRIAIVAVNCAGVPLADNWANSLLTLGIENFILIPLDSSTKMTLEAAYPGHVAPVLPGLDDSSQNNAYASFGMSSFKEVTASRPTFIRSFVEKGYNVLYNDADMVWKNNIWNEVDPEGSEEDAFFVADGASWSLCSCNMFLRPNEANMELLEIWRDEILTGWYENDQPAFNAAVHDRKHNVTWRLGDTETFPSGNQFFSTQDRSSVALVHANWLIGMEHKQARLAGTGNWHPSGRLDESLPCGLDITALTRDKYMKRMAEKSEKARQKREKAEAEKKAREERKQSALAKGNGWDESSGLEINILS